MIDAIALFIGRLVIWYIIVMGWCMIAAVLAGIGRDIFLSDKAMVGEAQACAFAGREWRRKNNGIGRKSSAEVTAK